MIIVKTKTNDGLCLNGLLSTSSIQSRKIIIHIHGMAGSPLMNAYYQSMHEKYSDENIAFLVTEHRGTGTVTEFATEKTSRTVGNAFELFEESILDIEAWVQFAEQEGYTEIWLQSHSLGTSKAAYYATTSSSPNIVGLLLLSPSDMIGLVHDQVGYQDHQKMLPIAKKLIQEGKGDALISHKLWGEYLLSAKTYLNFFDKGAKTAIFNFSDDSLGWDVVNAINIPVLAITGTKDDGIVPVIDPHEAMVKLKKELKRSPRVATVVIENAEHSFDGFDKEIIDEVITFINNA
jgi:pimeloyl-ACP methyl ester carboxylesterase